MKVALVLSLLLFSLVGVSVVVGEEEAVNSTSSIPTAVPGLVDTINNSTRTTTSSPTGVPVPVGTSSPTEEVDVFVHCFICGEGKIITIPETVVDLPWRTDPITCADLSELAQAGNYTAGECNLIQPFAAASCGCAETLQPTMSMTMAPTTAAPTAAPTIPAFEPYDDGCFTDLDEVAARESAVTDVSIPRTITLCAFTDFYMGRQDPASGTFVFGFNPINPRPNAHYKCGDTGNAANNCRILDGTYAIFSGGGGDPVRSNVTFEGITIESSQLLGVYAVAAGEMTFLDCIFRNHYNFAPFLIQFQQRQANVILAITFRQTVFENNTVLVGSQVPGIVTQGFPGTSLVFDNCVFRNNKYDDQSFPNTWAIQSQGPLTIRNTCFDDNDFRGLAPILSQGGSPMLHNNSWTNTNVVDDFSLCGFVQDFTTQQCLGVDSEQCMAQTRIPEAQPTDPPTPVTRVPVTRITESPTRTPPAPPAATSGGADARYHSMGGYSFHGVAAAAVFAALFL